MRNELADSFQEKLEGAVSVDDQESAVRVEIYQKSELLVCAYVLLSEEILGDEGSILLLVEIPGCFDVDGRVGLSIEEHFNAVMHVGLGAL